MPPKTSPKTPYGTILFEHPDIGSLRNEGYTLFDMHLHTNHSDGLTKVPHLIEYLKDRGINSAITDHNVIGGVIEAEKCLHGSYHDGAGPMIIPAVELETREGPHLLLYFYTADDLCEYNSRLCTEMMKLSPTLRKHLRVIDTLILAEDFDCLRVAAHPFGYYGINRGVLKCLLNGTLDNGVLDHLDGIEAICGGMVKGLNLKSIGYAREHALSGRISFTGGSDAHLLCDVGSVLCGTYGTQSVEEHLNAVKRHENIVIGRSDNPAHKSATAAVIAWSFIPGAKDAIISHYNAHKIIHDVKEKKE
ncbi:PHP domain-containing protein [Methanomicrobium mobile]|uniref:PHP domain-containing protein n=1 Tax=Methanomicrobium mobile TaxID=2205 RepID=UPI000693AD85|nr:PHP domain-containing protein [Methanomicrobium mobile]